MAHTWISSAILGAQKVPSLGLSTRAHVMVLVVCFLGAAFLLRLLRRRQLRGKYTLLWILTGIVVLAIASFPSGVDHVAHTLNIYNPPNALFLLAIAFLLLVCIYFSYELSRLEERTRLLAEELAILRGEVQATTKNGQAPVSNTVESGQVAGERDRS
ncbi:MAG TPA: DUF2304 domain-containing protein [Acidimicrobiia bacterium]